MIDALSAMDTSLFLALNGAIPALDGAMWWVSEPLFWTPLYVALMVASARRLGMGRPLAVFAACVALCVTGTDVVSARVLKPSVERLRPSHEPSLADQIHLVEERPGEVYRGGRFGFVSSHAANHMGVAVLFGMLSEAPGAGGCLHGHVDWPQPNPLGVHYPEMSWEASLWAGALGRRHGCWRALEWETQMQRSHAEASPP